MYPYSLLSADIELFPIFGSESRTSPAIIDYSIPEFCKIDPRSMQAMNKYNEKLLESAGAQWGLGWYLEDRSHILTGTHIREEGRIYHLGVDILFDAGAYIYSPLDGTVYERGYEPGEGNYGGYIIMEYHVWDSVFYALYGHLSVSSITEETMVKRGERLAQLGESHENGNWFPHLHLQVFTGVDLDIWKSRGYCSASDALRMEKICPNPLFLVRY